MNKVLMLLMAVTMTLGLYEGTSHAKEWYRPEMMQAFGRPGDTVIPQEWTTPEALKAFGKPGDTVRNPAIRKIHKQYDSSCRNYRGTRTKSTTLETPHVPRD
ncbi:MAG: hypothetical protein A2076_00240 [Geobacteraceae bacterium GWC2_53_11]|nr:MAG: hypothetical protein A2076_00240 [Geobacteraceae bacterium GWC2_53_11]